MTRDHDPERGPIRDPWGVLISARVLASTERIERILGWVMGLGIGSSFVFVIAAAAVGEGWLQNAFFVIVIAGLVVGIVIPLVVSGPLAAIAMLTPWAAPSGLLFTGGILLLAVGAVGADEALFDVDLPGGWVFGAFSMFLGAFSFWILAQIMDGAGVRASRRDRRRRTAPPRKGTRPSSR
ncbi:hypothetical protein [Salinibacterium sp. ZJ77]|uniref:hypothetical protein n=1 Tax=Salinibacterium sp. ZJ77 TaxID=2708337 RepID=UPI001421DF08|nr:hypothetical protein [Salinibacterium sp. ZJ77]